MPKCKKKKLLRIEKKLAKNPNSANKTLISREKSLEDYIAENDLLSIDGVKNLKVKIITSIVEGYG